MNIIILIIAIFFYGAGHPPVSYVKSETSLQECQADAAVAKAKLLPDAKISGVTIDCGEISVPVSAGT